MVRQGINGLMNIKAYTADYQSSKFPLMKLPHTTYKTMGRYDRILKCHKKIMCVRSVLEYNRIVLIVIVTRGYSEIEIY